MKLQSAVLIVVSLLLSLQGIEARRQDRVKDMPEETREWLIKIVGGIRNFWMGFQIDVFNRDQSKLDSRCLDLQSTDDMA